MFKKFLLSKLSQLFRKLLKMKLGLKPLVVVVLVMADTLPLSSGEQCFADDLFLKF